MAKYIGLPRWESGFADAPITRNSTDVKNVYFQNVDGRQVGNFMLYEDPAGKGTAFVQQLVEWNDTNGNGVIDEDELVKENFKLTIFVSQDASYLEKARESYIPEANELSIFLEDNSTDSVSGTYSGTNIGGPIVPEDESNATYYEIYVIAGKDITGVLADWFRKEFSLFEKELGKLGFQIDLTKRQLKELVETGRIETKGANFVKAIISIFNRINNVVSVVYDSIGSAILDVTKAVRYIRIDEYRWNPEKHETDDQKPVDNTSFTPFLLPYSHELLDLLEEQSEKGTQDVVKVLTSTLEAQKKEAMSKVKMLHKLSGNSLVSSKDLKKIMKKFEDVIDVGIDRIISTCENVVPVLISFGKRALNMINAYYCGLWNAIIEAVLGTVDLIGYIFKGMGYAYSAPQTLTDNLPDILEFIDELYQTIISVDYSELFRHGLNSIIKGVKDLDLSAISEGIGISFEKVAYFLGSFVGFVLEIIVGIVGIPATGGSSSLAPVFSFLSKFKVVGEIVESIVSTALAPVLRVAGSAVGQIFEFFKYLLELLKKGGKAIGELIETFFETLQKGLGDIAEFILVILRKLGLPDELCDIFQRVGLTITKSSETACSICLKV